jgi:hypothetical protein
MEVVTLPYDVTAEDEDQVRQVAITKEGRIAPSIRLEAPSFHFFSAPILTLNDEQHVQRAQNRQMRNQLLQLHGVSAVPNGPILREYLSFIFQTRTLAMYRFIEQTPWPAMNRTRSLRYQQIRSTARDREAKKVQVLAIRALYALGLDYGIVKCGVGTGKKIWVLQVLPSPKGSRELESLFMKAILQYRKQLQGAKIPLQKIVLGADPEFVMQSPTGNLLMASQYFPLKGKMGCDAISSEQNVAYKPLVEIRPDPDEDPRMLVARIYHMLWQEAEKMSDLPAKWLAGAMPYPGFPLGGHIHFSGIQPNFKMLRMLDNYLALPLVMAEDVNGKGRRPKYGFLGDFRYQDYGGFEYRTLPSWLVSPTLTKGVFALAKVIVANYQTLQYDPLASLTIQEAYYEGDKVALQSWIQKLWDDLQSCEDYRMYHKDLHAFYRYLTSGICWNETRDFRIPWRLPPYANQKQA